MSLLTVLEIMEQIHRHLGSGDSNERDSTSTHTQSNRYFARQSVVYGDAGFQRCSRGCHAARVAIVGWDETKAVEMLN